MALETNDADARLALDAINLRRRQVIAEIGMPWWYWWGVALGWVALGVVADLRHPWATLGGTLIFGAVHSAVAQHTLSGRHRSRQLSVRAGMVSWRLPALLLSYLVGLAAATVAIAVLVAADGAGHPGTIASVIAAVAVLCGGPALMAAVRRRAERTTGL